MFIVTREILCKIFCYIKKKIDKYLYRFKKEENDKIKCLLVLKNQKKVIKVKSSLLKIRISYTIYKISNNKNQKTQKE